MNILDTTSFVGFIFLLCSAIVGAYVILRWGWVGVANIWAMRGTIDERVKEEVKTVVDRRG